MTVHPTPPPPPPHHHHHHHRHLDSLTGLSTGVDKSSPGISIFCRPADFLPADGRLLVSHAVLLHGPTGLTRFLCPGGAHLCTGGGGGGCQVLFILFPGGAHLCTRDGGGGNVRSCSSFIIVVPICVQGGGGGVSGLVHPLSFWCPSTFRAVMSCLVHLFSWWYPSKFRARMSSPVHPLS